MPRWDCPTSSAVSHWTAAPFQPWWRFDRHHNHAQFSPTDPDEVLFAQEFHSDPITGLRFPITNRLWLIRRGGEPRPILREPRFVSHEWWDADGEHVWCVDGATTTRGECASPMARSS
jgi:hypothetical protein